MNDENNTNLMHRLESTFSPEQSKLLVEILMESRLHASSAGMTKAGDAEKLSLRLKSLRRSIRIILFMEIVGATMIGYLIYECFHDKTVGGFDALLLSVGCILIVSSALVLSSMISSASNLKRSIESVPKSNLTA